MPELVQVRVVPVAVRGRPSRARVLWVARDLRRQVLAVRLTVRAVVRGPLVAVPVTQLQVRLIRGQSGSCSAMSVRAPLRVRRARR